MTRLTSTLRPLTWPKEAEDALAFLKVLFSISLVHCHPDPAQQFVGEVDVSDTEVGEVLSEESSQEGKLHTCAFFSQRLSQVERNYDVGNRELLALVKGSAPVAGGCSRAFHRVDRPQELGPSLWGQAHECPAGSMVAFPGEIRAV